MSSSGGVAAVAIDAPPGIQFAPASVLSGPGDVSFTVPVWKDADGTPDRMCVVTVVTASTIAVITYSLIDNVWSHNPAVDARDDSIALSVTAASFTDITAFAVDSPGTATDPILFIATNDGSQTPDTFEMDSIRLTNGATSLTAVAVTIAGANQPTDTNGMGTVSTAVTNASRVMTFFQDDGHFADVIGDHTGFTFTYTDPKAITIDASIGADNAQHSAFSIGSQVILALLQPPNNSLMWEIDPDGVLIEEFNRFATGLMGGVQDAGSPSQRSRVTAIGGNFAVAAPVGGGDVGGSESAWIITAFLVDEY